MKYCKTLIFAARFTVVLLHYSAALAMHHKQTIYVHVHVYKGQTDANFLMDT